MTSGTNQQSGCGASTNKNSHAKSGFPGKLQAARTTAPDNATEADIQEVAAEAYQSDCRPREVWRERSNHGLSEFGGDTE